MAVVFKRTEGLQDVTTHYCPGCTHGIIHRLVAEVLEEMDVLGDAIGVVPVGCSVLAYKYFNVDTHEAAHGRAPAVATGVKRTHPDNVVFTYQGDGDLSSIGMAEIVHAAARGEKITTIFVNNGIYGMTGGQMAPTTLIGQKATTAQSGRSAEVNGFPIRVSEMLATLTGAVFVERVSVDTPANVRNNMMSYYELGNKKDIEVKLRRRNNMATSRVICAGFGGQGVMSMGQLLTYAGMLEGKEVAWLPSYGPEMRGGTANCAVTVSDKPVGSPVITDDATCAVIMNKPSMKLVNSSLIDMKVERDDVNVTYIPANELAAEIGMPKVANMIMLGACLKVTESVDIESVLQAFLKVFGERKSKFIPMNREALQKGMDAVATVEA